MMSHSFQPKKNEWQKNIFFAQKKCNFKACKGFTGLLLPSQHANQRAN